jgi:nucleoside-diphosphate-sugar epimerase
VAVLITGLGYIGGALAQRLVGLGHDVVAIENYFSAPRQQVEAIAPGKKLTIVEGSIVDPTVLERAFASAPIDAVFHTAAQASARPSAAPVTYTQETNYTGLRLVLEASFRAEVRHIVVASSTRLYRTPLPARVTEESPLHPPDLVHLSQLYGEHLLAAYRDRAAALADDSSSAILASSMVAARVGIVHGVGPVMKTDPDFLAVPQRFCVQVVRGERLVAAVGSHSVHAFIHLDDVVDGLMRCLELPSGVHVVNVAAEVRSVVDTAQVVARAAAQRGITADVQYVGRVRRYAERGVSSRLVQYGFRPTRRLEDSLPAVLDWYLEQQRMSRHPEGS